MAFELNIPTGQTYVINGTIMRFAESTTKKIRAVMADNIGKEIEFRRATEEEKALTYPTGGS